MAAVAAGDIVVVGTAVAADVDGKSVASSVNDFSRHNTST
jgi:hypothetical protein